jgi:hypothetical protein
MVSNLSGDPVGTHDHSRTQRDFIEVLDKNSTLLAKVPNNMVVVDDLMPHINGRSKSFKRPLYDLNGTVDPGTETPGFREKNLHFIDCSHG